MGKIAFVDDMPEADEAFVRAHREEVLALAADLGITDVKVGSRGRLVGTMSPTAVPGASFIFMARAAGVLEHLVFMYADYIAAKSNADDDLRGALPL
jgi:hypothetical protein